MNIIDSDSDESERVPFMKLTKAITSENCITWKRSPRPPLTKAEKNELISMVPSKVNILPTEEKRLWLYNEIKKIRKNSDDLGISILVHRDNVFKDSFEEFKNLSTREILSDLSIKFYNEGGLDCGDRKSVV